MRNVGCVLRKLLKGNNQYLYTTTSSTAWWNQNSDKFIACCLWTFTQLIHVLRFRRLLGIEFKRHSLNLTRRCNVTQQKVQLLLYRLEMSKVEWYLVLGSNQAVSQSGDELIRCRQNCGEWFLSVVTQHIQTPNWRATIEQHAHIGRNNGAKPWKLGVFRCNYLGICSTKDIALKVRSLEKWKILRSWCKSQHKQTFNSIKSFTRKPMTDLS